MTEASHQLFKQITRLTLLWGLLFGILLATASLSLIYLLTRHTGAPLLAASLAELLPPLVIILIGVVNLVGRKVYHLRQQFTAPGNHLRAMEC